jgi:adenylate cyclase
MLSATLAFAAAAGGWVVLCVAAYAGGAVLHVLWIPLAVTLAYVSSVAANYIREALERRQVTNTFKRYVAPEIVGEILKGGQKALQLGGRLTEIAVLFVDIRGFTPMSELLEPPRVVEILNHYLTLTSSCIIRHGGTLDKFVGDATMAFWGAPLPQENYTLGAAKAALDMVEGSRALGAELLERYGRTVSFGIGIHCGKAVVGNIGAPIRMDYTAIGETVNTAARLEANAPGGKILISRAVADALGETARTTSLGDAIKLKGKSEGFEILTLDSLEEYHTKERSAV